MKKRSRRTKPAPNAALFDAPGWATLGVCLFLVGIAAPVPSQYPLVALVVCALVSALLEAPAPRQRLPRPFMLAFVAFVLSTGVSIFLSDDPSRSLALSASWIPGVLLFVVISERFRSPGNLRAVYACFSGIALVLGLVLLAGRWLYGANPHAWLSELGLPVLVVPNDCHFLALCAPLSLILIHHKPRSLLAGVAVASIAATLLAILALGSRGAILTLITGLVVAGMLLRPRLGFLLGAGAVVVAAIGDAALGFPVASKFTHVVDTRISLWLLAWEMFLDAPWVGHGPHTYRVLYSGYLDAMVFPAWVRADPWGTEVPWAHNLYLELLAERGIIGFSAFASLIGTAFVFMLQGRHQASVEIRSLEAGAAGALLGLLASGFFEASLLRVWVVVLLFSLLGIISRVTALARSELDPEPRGG